MMGCDMRATLVSNPWGTLTTVCLTRVMHTGFVLTSALSLHAGRFLRALGKLAAQFGVAVVITNQVRGVRVVPYTAPVQQAGTQVFRLRCSAVEPCLNRFQPFSFLA